MALVFLAMMRVISPTNSGRVHFFGYTRMCGDGDGAEEAVVLRMVMMEMVPISSTLLLVCVWMCKIESVECLVA